MNHPVVLTKCVHHQIHVLVYQDGKGRTAAQVRNDISQGVDMWKPGCPLLFYFVEITKCTNGDHKCDQGCSSEYNNSYSCYCFGSNILADNNQTCLGKWIF